MSNKALMAKPLAKDEEDEDEEEEDEEETDEEDDGAEAATASASTSKAAPTTTHAATRSPAVRSEGSDTEGDEIFAHTGASQMRTAVAAQLQRARSARASERASKAAETLTESESLMQLREVVAEGAAAVSSATLASTIALLERFPGDAQVQLEGMRVLGKVTWSALPAQSPHHEASIPQQAFDATLRAMETHVADVDLVLAACAALRLMINHAKRFDPAQTKRAADTVTAAMRAHPPNPSVQAATCQALSSIAIVGDKNVLLSMSVHHTVQVALSTHLPDPAVQVAGLGALAVFAYEHQQFKSLMCVEPAMAHLTVLAAMRSHRDRADVQQKGVSAISIFAFKHDHNQTVLLDNFAHEAIAAAIDKFGTDAAFVSEAADAVLAFAANPWLRRRLIDAGLLDKAMALKRPFANRPDVRDRLDDVVAKLQESLVLYYMRHTCCPCI